MGTPCRDISREALLALMTGDIPAIHLPGFASRDECEQLCAALGQVEADAQEATTSPMRLIGSNFSNYHGEEKSQYFASVAASYARYEQLTSMAFESACPDGESSSSRLVGLRWGCD